jgi:tRNA pseudouridine38-40 synthase
MRSRYVFDYPKPLDLGAMQRAASDLVGEHDFLAFSQQIIEGKSTVRTLYDVSVRQVRDEIWIDIVGSAFVRGMMRRMSGALWDIGRGARPDDEIKRLLGQRVKEQIKWPTVLPACGLTLMKISYGRHPQPQRNLQKTDLNSVEE